MDKLTKKEHEELKRIEKIEAEKQFKKQSMIKNLVIWGGIVALIVLSVFALVKLNSGSSVLSSTQVNLQPVTSKDIILGNKNAKVVIIEYSDFECPACAVANTLVKPVINEYKDKVLFAYRFYPLRTNHKNAVISAQAAYAAGKQDKFWEMHDMLFENQIDWSGKDNAREIFISYAEKFNLNIDKFKKDMDSDEAQKVISENEESGNKIGLYQTPTFLINGRMIQNPQSGEEFKQYIINELK